MFGLTWKASERKYGYVVERDVKILMSDGVKLNCDIWKPDANQKFPAILGIHCYHPAAQTGPIKPNGDVDRTMAPSRPRSAQTLHSKAAIRPFSHAVATSTWSAMCAGPENPRANGSSSARKNSRMSTRRPNG